MNERVPHRGKLDGPDVKTGAYPLEVRGVVRVYLRGAADGTIAEARWEAPEIVGDDLPLARCLEALCMNAVGPGLALLHSLDDFQLRAGCPENLRDSRDAGLAVRVFRAALEQLRPGARGPGYLSSGLLLLTLDPGARPSLDAISPHFRHHYREDLWESAASEARDSGRLGPAAACAYIGGLISVCDAQLELSWPVEEGAASWKWLAEQLLPEVAGSAERAKQLLSGGFGGAVGEGPFSFGHLAGGPWAVPPNFDQPAAVGHAEFVLMDLEERLPRFPEGRVVVATPRWMAVGDTGDDSDVRRADIALEDMGDVLRLRAR